MVPDRLQPIVDQVRPVAERFDAAGKCIYLVGGISTSSAASPAICW